MKPAPVCELSNNISVSLESKCPLDFDFEFLYSNLEFNLARIAPPAGVPFVSHVIKSHH
jgi:hypothetical protein